MLNFIRLCALLCLLKSSSCKILYDCVFCCLLKDSPRSISAAVLKISQQGLLTTSDIGIMVSRGDIQIAPPHNPSGTAMYENHSCRATFTGQSTMSSESTNLEIVDVEGDERVGDDASSTSLIYSGK